MYPTEVFDDIVCESYQKAIQGRVLGSGWGYSGALTGQNYANSKDSYGFFQKIVDNGQIVNNVYDFLMPMVLTACDRYGFEAKSIAQARSFLQPPMVETTPDPLHVDQKFEHLVLLYYVLDTDGNTLLSNKHYDENTTTNLEDYIVVKSVYPKGGRVVFFDGSIYHTCEKPILGPRCVVNFNLIGNFK